MTHWANTHFIRRKGPFGTVRTCKHCVYSNTVSTEHSKAHQGANSRAHWAIIRHIINSHIKVREVENG